jgi:hypothetical protein
MKKLILSTAALIVTVASVYGQGEVIFNNRITGSVEARVTNPDGSGVGAGFTAQLFGAPQTTVEANLVALTPTTTFRTSSAAAQGYVNQVTVAVPGVASGLTATLQMRVFDSSGALVGKSNMIDVQLGGNTLPPANLVGLAPFTIPEPSTIVLAALGGLGLLAIRRRK